jgi:hypothetical protein
VDLQVGRITSTSLAAYSTDWKLQTDPNFDYHMFQAEGGPAGGFVQVSEGGSEGMAQYKPGEVLLYIATDDINATLAQVEAHGGKTVLPKTEIPHVGHTKTSVVKSPLNQPLRLAGHSTTRNNRGLYYLKS